jgi:hypothetical protein
LEEKDYIKDLFSEKLGNHEVQVNSELWSAIESKIPSQSLVTSSSTGISTLAKSILGIGVAAGIVSVSYFLFKDKQTETSEIRKENNILVESEKNEEFIENTEIETIKSVKTQRNSTINTDFTKKQNIVSQSNKKEVIQEEIILNENKNTSEKLELLTDIVPEKIVAQQDEKVNKVESKTPETSQSTVKSSENSIEEKDYFIGKLLNVFTPNNDNSNDEFFIEIKGLTDFSLIVMDKDNKRVFTTTDPNFRWNGKDFSDNLVPVGQYLYFFTGIDSKGNTITKSNTLKIQY